MVSHCMRCRMWPSMPIIATGCAVYQVLGVFDNKLVVFLIMLMGGILLLLSTFFGMNQILIGRNSQNSLWEIATGLALFLFGFLTAGCVQGYLGIQKSRTSFGIRMEDIREIEFFLLEDPSPLRKGSWRANAHLIKTQSEVLTSEARGRIMVIGNTPWLELGLGRIVNASGGFSSGDDSEVVWYADSSLPGEWKMEIMRTRHRILRYMRKKLMQCSYDTYTFLHALILGTRIDSGSRIIRNFREAGCMHLLALSGFHIGLIVIAAQCLSKGPLGIRGSIIMSLILVLFYLLLVGYRPSLMRAVFMYGLWTVDRCRGYKTSPINYLCTAFVFQSVLFPYSIHSLSFILSYAALAGILTGGLSLSRIISRYLPSKIAGIIGISLGAQFATMPIVMRVFGVWRPVSILSAAILTPFVALAMALGGIAMIIPTGEVALFIAAFLDSLVGWMTEIAAVFARMPTLQIGLVLPWLLMAAGPILPLLYRGEAHVIKPQLPSLNPKVLTIKRNLAKETLGAELPD